jgi:hypothetical protein
MGREPHIQPGESQEPDWAKVMRRLNPPREGTGEGLTLIACTDIGCWLPGKETWAEFLARKGAPPDTTLEVDGETLFGPEPKLKG